MHPYFDDKNVLVTGGTGTFGRAFVAKLLSETRAKKIVILSRDEFKQSEMERENADPEGRLRFFLGDVRDLARLERAFEGIDIVVHAAALKQVPALEYNPGEAVKTNILGTQNVIEAALNCNADKVLLVSSDKAVQPMNLYGATKLCAERLTIAANAYRGASRRTKFSVVRYGNVLGSRGSLLDVIQRQRSSGTVMLTDERMTRFWTTVDEVMERVFDSIDRMHGGEIFVPKMKSLRIPDVIRSIAPDCQVKITGIRPSEKLHEMLITEHEARRTRDAGSVYVIIPEFGWTDEKWLAGAPRLSDDFIYASDHPDFLLEGERVKMVLRL